MPGHLKVAAAANLRKGRLGGEKSLSRLPNLPCNCTPLIRLTASRWILQATNYLQPRSRQLITDVRVPDRHPEDQRDQKHDQGILNEALAFLLFN